MNSHRLASRPLDASRIDKNSPIIECYTHFSQGVAAGRDWIMNTYLASLGLLAYEEKEGLLEDRSNSDVESDAGRSDTDGRYSDWTRLIFSPIDYFFSIPWRIVLVRFLWFLVPSFLQGRHAREQIRPAKLGPTAYLDGMRGLAALFVYFCHYSYQAFTIAEGWGCGTSNYHILKLPFLRLWYQGPAAVCVFFVISGYALSYRPLKLARGGNMEGFATTMSSLTFRRGIRLFLPPAISTFMVVCLLRLGAYELTRDFANDKKYMKNIVEPHPELLDSAFEQWKDWAKQMFKFMQVFSWDKYAGSTRYDVHLWTIPVEFRCSLYVFLTLLGTARLQTKFRYLTLAGVTWFTYRQSHWELVLFFFGMGLAELDHVRGAHVAKPAIPLDEMTEPVKSNGAMSYFWFFLSLLGLYLLGQPDGRGDITPGWIWLESIIPKWWSEEAFRYWQSTGAMIFVLAVGFSPSWQRFFNTAVVQYFGKISYALYLMHGPAMHIVGYHLERFAYGFTGVEGHWFNMGFMLGACLVVPTVVWWADVFWRAVDIPTVRFAKMVENRLLAKHD